MTQRSRRHPPRLALWLLETFLPAEERDAVIGDLLEAHEGRATMAAVRAWGAFWRETIAALPQLQLLPASTAAFTPYTRETFMQSMVSDLRGAVRSLSRARAFVALCILTLGVAIGATAAIYSVLSPVLLRPLPFPHPERLVTVHERELDGNASNIGFLTFRDLRDRSHTLEHAAAYGSWQPTLFGDQDAERLTGQVVSWEYFRTLGVRPVLGRDFEASDDTPDNRNVVILSHGLWQRRFAGDPAIIGRSINTGAYSSRVVGVMPASFDNVLSPSAQIWRVLGYSASQPWACRTCRHLRMVGRAREGVALAAVRGEMDALLAGIIKENPKEYASSGATTYMLQDRITRNARPILLALGGAVLLVLLIAAANVINLQLARTARRQEEFAVRSALGAGRARIARLLLAEGAVLALGSAIAGVLVAWLTLPALTAWLPSNRPRASAIVIDWRTLVFVAVVAAIAAIAVGLIPAAGPRGSTFDALRAGGRNLGGQRHRIRATLVVTEVALALMLLIGATLLARSIGRLLAVDAGFDPRNLLTMVVQASGSAYSTKESVFQNHDRIRAAVRSVPGVIDVALATQLPLGGDYDRYGVAAQDKPLDNPELAPSADRYTIAGDFLRTMRIPVVAGRSFTEAEAADSNAQVAVISDALAKRIWPGENALGKYIRLGGPQRPWKQVIGIAGNIRHTSLDATETLQVYVPDRQWFNEENVMVLMVRTAGDPARMTAAIRGAVRGVDPLQPIANIATMSSVVDGSTRQRRLGLLVFGAFSGMALLLACAGIYGVLAGSVAERTREFGLRTAMGATPGAIMTLVLRHAGRLTGAGLVLGLAGAVVLTRYLQSLLYGVAPTDPSSLAIAAAIIAFVATLSCLAPVRRAVRVDPAIALRSD
jgi:putative ABC transport system permease protein